MMRAVQGVVKGFFAGWRSRCVLGSYFCMGASFSNVWLQSALTYLRQMALCCASTAKAFWKAQPLIFVVQMSLPEDVVKMNVLPFLACGHVPNAVSRAWRPCWRRRTPGRVA